MGDNDDKQLRLYKLFSEVSSTATEVHRIAIEKEEIAIGSSLSHTVELTLTYIEDFKPVERQPILVAPATPSASVPISPPWRIGAPPKSPAELQLEHEEWLRGIYKEIWENISNNRQELINAGRYDAAKPELFRCVDAYIDMMNSDQINSVLGQVAAAMTLLLCWINVIKKDLLTISINK